MKITLLSYGDVVSIVSSIQKTKGHLKDGIFSVNDNCNYSEPKAYCGSETS